MEHDPQPAGSPNLLNESPLDVPEAGEDSKRGGFLGFFRELPVLIIIAFALAMLIKTFLVQAFFIPSESMVPTLLVGDRVLVNKLVYRFREPRRGEVIVFIEEDEDHPRPPRSFLRRAVDFVVEGFGLSPPAERDFIKRVVALPGETIQIRRGRVTITPVTGRRFRLDEPYAVAQPDDDAFGPFKVPEDEFFVMGDNRPNSADSRTTLGTIHQDDIVGRAFIRIWPVRRVDTLKRPDYAPAPRASAMPPPWLLPFPAGPGRRRRRRVA